MGEYDTAKIMFHFFETAESLAFLRPNDKEFKTLLWLFSVS